MTTAERGWPEVLEQAEWLCREVARQELQGLAVYVVPQSTLPAELGGASRRGGHTGPHLDLQLREHLADRWTGRGPALVLNDTPLRARWNPVRTPLDVFAVAVHELGHALDFGADQYRTRPPAGPAALRDQALADGRSLARDPAPADWRGIIGAGHQPRWVRIALHLTLRAAVRAGVALAGDAVLAYPQFSAAVEYRRRLGGELIDGLDAPLDEVLARPEPPAFLALWFADFNRLGAGVAPAEG